MSRSSFTDCSIKAIKKSAEEDTMDIESRIASRMRAVRPHRRYREYSLSFKVLLGITDAVTWLYFFGVPFFPHLLPHLSSFQPVIQFFIEGMRKGM
jgi:hypothetical protein